MNADTALVGLLETPSAALLHVCHNEPDILSFKITFKTEKRSKFYCSSCKFIFQKIFGIPGKKPENGEKLFSI